MDVTYIKTAPDTYVQARLVHQAVCCPRYELTGTVIAAEAGLFVDAEGNDIAAACVLGRWHDIRHIGSATGWTDMNGHQLPDDVMRRINEATPPTTTATDIAAKPRQGAPALKVPAHEASKAVTSHNDRI